MNIPRFLTAPSASGTSTSPDRSCMRHVVPLSEVLATVDRHCGMLDAFSHWQQSHVQQASAEALTIAGIMSLGCAIGVRKTARISRAISERELEHVVNRRFSLDNITAANDRVLAASERMELPQIHRTSQTELHTSSDGQKFEVRQPSLNASHSFKYFGQGQGVSAYTFIDERSLLWYSLVFSAAERESAYVIDGLMHNDVVQSDIHSTDEHGFSEAIFGVTHLLGLSYAPRFKNLKKQILYHFRGHDMAGWMISPTKYVNERVVRASWDDLLRLVATIKLKEATASEIFRRLNSYSRQHSLYKAMKAFGQIIKSLFILRYVDEVELRQAIERQLNKAELANSFTRAIAVGNPRGLEYADKIEQETSGSGTAMLPCPWPGPQGDDSPPQGPLTGPVARTCRTCRVRDLAPPFLGVRKRWSVCRMSRKSSAPSVALGDAARQLVAHRRVSTVYTNSDKTYDPIGSV